MNPCYRGKNIYNDVHISIVSHGQGDLVALLLDDLAMLPCASRLQVTVTQNIPESVEFMRKDYRFPLKIIRNDCIKGFGENHNFAFAQASYLDERRYFVVVNPDVRIQDDVMTPLIEMLEQNQTTGVAAPLVQTSDGLIEDSARFLPGPIRIVAKLFGQQGRWVSDGAERYFHPDWVAGMFMGFRAEVFKGIGGFDEGYFLYYEDVDLCSRLWLEGFTVQVDSTISVIHDARRSSRRNLRYMKWHLASIARFFGSDVYRRVKQFHEDRVQIGM